MSGYVGKGLLHGSYVHNSFNGNGTTVNFTLSTSPGSANALLVMVDNVLQSPSAFSVSGTTLTFTSAPASGTNNIRVWIMGRELDIGKPAAATVGQAEIETTTLNPIVQVVTAINDTYSSGTTNVVFDDTIPQSTEGEEVLTVTITPKSATNILLVEGVVATASNAAGTAAVASLFVDSETDARAAFSSAKNDTANGQSSIPFLFKMAAGSTSAITFKVRAGHSSGTTYFNGLSSGRLFGGVMYSFIKVTEIVQ